MASALPPVKGVAFSFEIGLTSQADTNIFKTGVTIAAADVLISKDGGATAQIASVPAEIGTSGLLTVALSATEMNADRVTVLFHDASGAEWQDAVVTIYTAAQTLDTTDGVVDTVKTDTAAILADTGTEGVKIAADAITSAAFDESTAFPLKAADSGSTYVARTGADSDTLETLSDQMDLAALEATLTAIKGAGWTAETLKALDTLLDAVKLKTDLITANSITVVSPVNSDGDIEIDRGYDYYAVDGRSLTWTDETPATWPDLTGATVTFRCWRLEKECTVSNPAGPATITLELSAANTEDLPVRDSPFVIDAELDNGHLVLQIRGIITVRG